MLSHPLEQCVQCVPNLREDLTATRVKSYQLEAGAFKLSYATELVTEAILSQLFAFAEEKKALEWMLKMQSGEVINKLENIPSENRSVLHTALRIPKGQVPLSQKASFIAEKNQQELTRLQQFLTEVMDFTTLVQVGIGGSSLGPEAVYQALKPYGIKGREAHFIANIDPDASYSILNSLDLKKTLFVIVSKSGTTLETLTNEALIRERLKEEGLDPKQHLIAVTEEKSLMDNLLYYREVFYIWDSIGGRFSVTSMVGAVVLSFILGYASFLQFLEGAYEMDQIALKVSPNENLPLFAALLGVWNHSFLKIPTIAVIPYSEALSRFPAYLQQLSMESNGKHISRQGEKVSYPTGPIVWGEPGTNGQHSFFQLLHQGDLLASLEFIGFLEPAYGFDLEIDKSLSQEKLLGNMIAQAISLAAGESSQNPNKHFEGGRPSHILMAKKCDPFTLGSLMAYYEHKIAFQGFLWGINSFDQEGVQLGKRLSSKMIEEMVLSRANKASKDPLLHAYVNFIQD
ncbi:glucose-6-phosphate isomerase [Rhabdochlamydiaceae symbiont of Dictyostelium giganteum]|uniref:glucose-6-phosphate isomerase n=1 Tax=Rhabdochlamydiaceae symbiont of Dictyostelium giganteum TaxID=3342349 RepID=UPI00384B9C59